MCITIRLILLFYFSAYVIRWISYSHSPKYLRILLTMVWKVLIVQPKKINDILRLYNVPFYKDFCSVLVVQSISHVKLFATPWSEACQSSLSFTVSQSLLKLMPIELMIPSYQLILCHLLLLLPSIFPSSRVFSSELTLHIRWPKYWSLSFSFSISSSNGYSGLISFRIDWVDLLAVQGTLKSLLQHWDSKASILWCSSLFMVQLSHLYMTTGEIIALTRWAFVGKVMSLLFNMLYRLVIAFLPRSKCLLISWMQSLSAVILEPKKLKSVAVSIFFPLIYLPKVMGLDAMIVVPLSDIKPIHKLGKPPPVSSYDMFP